MSRALRHILVIAIATLLVAGGGVAQAADKAFSCRWAQTMRGDVLALGNTSLSCPTANANCANARNRVGAYNNNDFTMANVDVDGDGSTFNSSRATVALPAGATLAWAGLYWAADTSAGGSGRPLHRRQPRPGPRQGRLGRLPGRHVDGDADLDAAAQPLPRLRRHHGLLAATGSQDVTVANIQAGTGSDRFPGWSLIVAYRDATKPIRRLNVYDGLGTVDATHTFETIIAPFQTPATGRHVARRSRLLRGRRQPPHGNRQVQRRRHDRRPQPGQQLPELDDRVRRRASHRQVAELPQPARRRHRLGLPTSVLSSSQSSALMRFTSTQDYFMPSAFFLTSDEGPALNTGAPSVSGTARDGETLTAGAGTWSGTPSITYTYQWQRCNWAGANCADIPGATGSSYTLTAADVGSTVRVQVVASNDAGSSPPATSSVSTAVVKMPPVNLTAPLVSGTARDEVLLTSTTGTWDGTGPLAYTYQWQRCDTAGNNCVAIPGATASTYRLADAAQRRPHGPQHRAGHQRRRQRRQGLRRVRRGARRRRRPTRPPRSCPARRATARSSPPTPEPGRIADLRILLAALRRRRPQLRAHRRRNGVDVRARRRRRGLDDPRRRDRQQRRRRTTATTAGHRRDHHRAADQLRLPVLGGTATMGQTLSSTTGTWTAGTRPTPTSGAGAMRGASCSDIGGATGTYVLVTPT